MVKDSKFDNAALYQKIGEFVVIFQWIEHLIRQIGWFLIDPDIKSWPKEELRNESNSNLLMIVEKLHSEFSDKYNLSQASGFKINFNETIQAFHNLRQYRNKLLHSAFIELKSGGDELGWISSSVRLKKHEITGELILSNELLTVESIDVEIEQCSKSIFQMNLYFTQLKHWYGSKRSL